MSTQMTVEEWRTQGELLFGKDRMQWKVKCPCCGYVASLQDYKDAGAPSGAFGFNCIGRYIGAKREALGGKGDGPCNYAGGGLLRLHPVDVAGTPVFEFAAVPAA